MYDIRCIPYQTKAFHHPAPNLFLLAILRVDRDTMNNGIRIFRFNTTIKQTFQSVYETALLFKPFTTKGVDDESAQRNLNFLASYTGTWFSIGGCSSGFFLCSSVDFFSSPLSLLLSIWLCFDLIVYII